MKTKKLIRQVIEEYDNGRLTADVAMFVIANLVKKKERPTCVHTADDNTAINWGVETIKRLTLHNGTNMDTNKHDISVSRNL